VSELTRSFFFHRKWNYTVTTTTCATLHIPIVLKNMIQLQQEKPNKKGDCNRKCGMLLRFIAWLPASNGWGKDTVTCCIQDENVEQMYQRQTNYQHTYTYLYPVEMIQEYRPPLWSFFRSFEAQKLLHHRHVVYHTFRCRRI
jgi:hypothetical protein